MRHHFLWEQCKTHYGNDFEERVRWNETEHRIEKIRVNRNPRLPPRIPISRPTETSDLERNADGSIVTGYTSEQLTQMMAESKQRCADLKSGKRVSKAMQKENYTEEEIRSMQEDLELNR